MKHELLDYSSSVMWQHFR